MNCLSVKNLVLIKKKKCSLAGAVRKNQRKNFSFFFFFCSNDHKSQTKPFSESHYSVSTTSLN